MNNLIIRKAKLSDIEEILQVFEAAKNYMYNCGNLTQWEKEYPSYMLIEEDIKKDSF